jgi:hypothetical protein
MSETKISNLPTNPEEEGVYLHDMVSKDYDAAIDNGKPVVDEDKDFVYELPGSGFHDAGMYNEAERQSDGAHYDEANGKSYKEDLDEATLAEHQYGAQVIADHEIDLVLNAPLEEDGDATDKWLAMVEEAGTPEAKQKATAAWLEQQKREL